MKILTDNFGSSSRLLPVTMFGPERLTSLSQLMILFLLVLISFIGPAVSAGQWHCPSAQLAFTLRPDTDKSVIPDIHLADVRLVNPDSTGNLSFGPQPGKALYKTLNGRIRSYFMAVKGTGIAVYRCNGRYRGFTAQVGLADNASDAARVRVEVWADNERLFVSPQIDKYARAIEINVAVAPEVRKLKLLTMVSGDNGSEVIWSAPGFLELGKFPPGSLADLYLPDGIIGPISAVKVFDSTGVEVSAHIVSNVRHQPLRIIFDSSSGSELYYHAYVFTAADDTALSQSAPWPHPAGLSLETKILTQNIEQVYTHPGFMEAWSGAARPVDFRPVDAVHASYPAALLGPGDKLINQQNSSLALYTYKGWFNIHQAGEYDFATASNWGSTVFVDDRFVVHWPGKHDFHAGRRCQYSGKIYLEPGIHKFEYMNYNKWGSQFTMCAWRYADGVYRIMTAPEFLSWGYYRPDSIQSAKSDLCGSFSWQVTDDMRADIADGSPALVAIGFQVIPPAGYDTDQLEYRWRLGDGLIAQGAQIEHVYLARGLYEVTLTAVRAGNTVFTARQMVCADIDTDRLRCEPRNQQLFDNALDPVFLAHADINSLKGLFRLATELEMDPLRSATADIICARPPDSLATGADPDFYYELAVYLSAITSDQTTKALELLTAMLSSDNIEKDKRFIDARLLYIRLLIDHAADYGLALRELERLKGDLSLKQILTAKILRAEIDLGCGRALAESDYFTMPTGSPADENMRQQELTAILRRARLAAQGADQKMIAASFNELSEALNKSPAWLFTPDFNLARLALLKAAGSSLRQANIAGRCMALSASDNIMHQLLYLRAQAFLALEQPEPADLILQQMQQQYPYCPETARLADMIKDQ